LYGEVFFWVFDDAVIASVNRTINGSTTDEHERVKKEMVVV
jgi:hypothetical protein